MTFNEYRMPTKELKEMSRGEWMQAWVRAGQFLGVGGAMMALGMKHAAASAVSRLCISQTGACGNYIQSINGTMETTLLASALVLVAAVLGDLAMADGTATGGDR